MNFFFDVGGTKTKIGWSKNLKKIDGYKILDTPKKYKDFLNFIKENIGTYKVTRIVFGFPGVFDEKKEKLIYSPNLKDFENRNLKRDLKKILKTKIYFENDALLAGLGEAVYGAGRKYNIVAYITLSTGVGGARIVNKRPDEKFFGFEPGHSIFLNIFALGSGASPPARSMRQSGLRFATARTFSHCLPESRSQDGLAFKERMWAKIFEFEDLISSSAIERIFGKKPEEIKNKSFWKKVSFLVSIFLVNVALFWSPEVIVLGGGMTKSLDINLIRKNFNKLFPFKIKLKILKSKLQNLSAIYGGLAYLNLCQ